MSEVRPKIGIDLHSVAPHVSDSGLSMCQRILSAIQPVTLFMNNVSSGGSKALRCIQIIKTLSSAAYYQSPEAKRHVLEKGGIFGKLAQTLLLKPGIIEGISGNKAEAEAEIIRLINCLKTSLSMQQVGEIDPERVLDTLKESISQGKGAAVSDMLAYHHAGSRNDLSGRSCLY